jgi:hypothetical protein
MSLPKINLPVYDLVLPLSKTKVKFKPFTVKEQKILLLALESDNPEFINENIKQIIRNCCITEIDVDSLAAVDIEFFFINLRARSVGEQVDLKYRCENVIDQETGEVCKNKLDISYNVLDIKLDSEDYKDVIPLTSTIGVKMKFPDYSALEKMRMSTSATKAAFDVVVSCIEYIYDDDQFYYAKETKKEELVDFIESLNVDQFNHIQKFFEQMPKLQKVIKTKCSKCGYDHTITIEGLENFFE